MKGSGGVIRSMTGYGRAKETRNGRDITVELRSVNNRYLDCTVKMPRSYVFAEDAIKNLVQKGTSRGKVDVFISVESTGTEEAIVSVNTPLAQSYISAMETLKKLAGNNAKTDYCVTDLARLPDILTVSKAEEDLEMLSGDLCAVVAAAIQAHTAMRETEGARLALDIRSRAAAIAALLAKVEERAPHIVEDYRSQIDESRILTEAAVYADKVATDEETVRLHSHLAQLEEMLDQGGAVGRKLDFLIQEFNREVNTIGSKCNDLETSRLVVDMKAEIEKIREQIQNLE